MSILLLTAGVAVGAEAPVQFVSSFQLQDTYQRDPGTYDVDVLLQHECPAGATQPAPGCRTTKILYSRRAGVPKPELADYLEPAPDRWKEIVLPPGVPVHIEKVQWGTAMSRFEIESGGDALSGHVALVLRGYYQVTSENIVFWKPVVWVSLLRNSEFLMPFPMDERLFERISNENDPWTVFHQMENPSYVQVPLKYTDPDAVYDRTLEWRLFLVKDLAMTARSRDALLAEKAVQDARRKEEEAAQQAQEAKDAAERAAWAAKANSPQELKAVQKNLAAVFQAWGALVSRNVRARQPCGSIAIDSGANLLRLNEGYQSIRSSPVPKAVLYQEFLRDAQISYGMLQNHLRSLGCGG